MKNPWVVQYWCVYADKVCRKGYPTYETALVAQVKLKKRGHFNVQVMPK